MLTYFFAFLIWKIPKLQTLKISRPKLVGFDEMTLVTPAWPSELPLALLSHLLEVKVMLNVTG